MLLTQYGMCPGLAFTPDQDQLTLVLVWLSD